MSLPPLSGSSALLAGTTDRRSELLRVCAQLREGVEVRARTKFFRSVGKAFVAREAVRFLVNHKLAEDEQAAVALCTSVTVTVTVAVAVTVTAKRSSSGDLHVADLVFVQRFCLLTICIRHIFFFLNGSLYVRTVPCPS